MKTLHGLYKEGNKPYIDLQFNDHEVCREVKTYVSKRFVKLVMMVKWNLAV